MQKKNTAKRPLKPTAEQKSTARILSLLYAGGLDVRGGLVHRTTLYLNRLLRDTGTPKKGKPRHELYLEAVAKPGTNLTYDSWVQPLAREAWEEHSHSPTARIRDRLSLTYTGRPNARDAELIDALLAFARLNLTILPAEARDLAETIYRASVGAWRKTRKQYKDDRLPGALDDAMRVLHVKLLQIAEGKRPGEGYTSAFIASGERGLSQWYGGTADTGLDPAELISESDETPATADDSPARVVDLACWLDSHPRPIRNLMFAEKGGADA